MLQIIRRWVRNGIAPLALAALSVAAGCHIEPYWEGRPMAGPKNPTCYPENEWGGFYPTCWRQWPECAPRCKKDSDVAVTVDEGAVQSSPPFAAETPVPSKPKAAPEVGVPKKPVVNPETPAPAAKPDAGKPPAPIKSSSDQPPAARDATEPVGDTPAMEDEATGRGQDDGWLIVEEKARPDAAGQTNATAESRAASSREWKPSVRQTSSTEYLRSMQDSSRGPAFR